MAERTFHAPARHTGEEMILHGIRATEDQEPGFRPLRPGNGRFVGNNPVPLAEEAALSFASRSA